MIEGKVGGITAGYLRCLSPLLRRVLKDEDDYKQRMRKLTFSIVASVLAIVIPVHMALTSYTDQRSGMGLYYVWTSYGVLVSFAILAYMLKYKSCNDRFTTVVICCLCVMTAMADLHGLSQMGAERAGMFFVIMLDITLVCNVPARASYWILGAILAWLLLMTFELRFRWGMLEVPGTPDAATRLEKVCGCAMPPCALDSARFYRTIITIFVVYLLDFGLTRRFAREAVSERDKMVEAVRTCDQIARCFVRFDLFRASTILEESDLPDDIASALSSVLDNLRSYRPYLPDALFSKDHAQTDLMAVPGFNNSEATIVFTDIRQSTALWLHSDAAMRRALDIHNCLIRDSIMENNGYEIKTIGDAFMVAFSDGIDAVRFGLDVQSKVLTQEWPEGLSRGCNADSEFSLRIGLHRGEVALELSAITGRYDYFGTTVNQAARLEGCGVPGGVTLTTKLVQEMDLERALADKAVFIPHKEPHFAKGFTMPMHLVTLVGRDAAAYLPHVRANCEGQSTDVNLRSQNARRGRLASPGAKKQFRSTAFGHRNALGTVCVMRLGSVEQLMSLGSCLHTGTITCVFGNFCVASWGVHRRAKEPFRSAVTCVASVLAENEKQSLREPVHVGLATGRVVMSHVAVAIAQRFLTIAGPSVDLAMMLCAGAAELDVVALATHLEGLPDAGIRLGDGSEHAAVRPVDSWEFFVNKGSMQDSSAGARSVGADAAAAGAASASRSRSKSESGSESDATWSTVSDEGVTIGVFEVAFALDWSAETHAEYKTAYTERNLESLQRLATLHNDHVVQYVRAMVEGRLHFPHPFILSSDETMEEPQLFVPRSPKSPRGRDGGGDAFVRAEKSQLMGASSSRTSRSMSLAVSDV